MKLNVNNNLFEIICNLIGVVYCLLVFETCFCTYLRHLLRDQIKSILLFVCEVYFIITINYLSLKYVKVMKTEPNLTTSLCSSVLTIRTVDNNTNAIADSLCHKSL